MEREERLRKLYVISKALYLGIKQLSKEAHVFTKDEQTQEDLRDMQELYDEIYGAYVPPQGWGQEVQRPTTVTVRRTLWNVK